MKVYLRDRKTKHYYAAFGRTSPATKHALDFTNVGLASKFALDLELPEMEIVLSYANHVHEVSLPVLLQWHEFESRRPAA